MPNNDDKIIHVLIGNSVEDQSIIRKLRVIFETAVYPDVVRLRAEGEGRTEGTWAGDLGQMWEKRLESPRGETWKKTAW